MTDLQFRKNVLSYGNIFLIYTMHPLKILSVIIPVYNEERTISQTLYQVTEQELFGWRKQIIIVDDGSGDGTYREIQPWTRRIHPDWEIALLRHEHNRGKGAAVRTGLTIANGEAVIIQDADLEYHPRDIPALLKVLENLHITAVYGSRLLEPTKSRYRHYVWGVKALTAFTNLLFGSHLTDVYTGYKVFRLSHIRSCALTANGFEFEAEVTAQLLKQGGVIREVPITYSPRRFHEGKKIRARDGVIGAWTLLKNRIF